MKRYLDLAPISARVHRKQCRMSVFCIVLSVFLATAIFGMADMYVRSQIVQTQAESGNWHVGIRGISDEDASVVAARPDVDALASYNILNYDGGQGYALDGTEAVICGTDETLVTDIFPGMVAEGRFPRSDSEAVLTENARDMLDLSVGDEIVIATPGGAERRFTVSGFAKNASNLMSGDSYGVIVTAECFRSLSPNAGEGAGSLSDATVYFVQFTDARDVQSKVADLKRRLGLNDEQVFENTKLLGLLGQSSNSFMTQIYAGAGVLGALVLLSSVMMIASGLNINVSQRTEFFGLMRCIGATPKQVMRLVRKEALGWCRFAIPVGIAAGVVLTWALCLVLRALSPEYFGSMPTLAVSLPSILAGAVVGLLTVLLAARSPAKRASKVSPLSAVSGSANDLQPVRKAANTKWLKVETSLGIHHAKSSRKNYVLTIASFGLCIVLFLSFSVTIDFMHHALTPLYPWTPDISIVSTDNTRSVDSGYVDELENNPAVETVYGRMFAYDVPAMVNGEPLTVDLISYERSQFQWAADYLQSGTLDAARNELGTGLAVFDSQGTVRDGDSVVLEVGGEHAEIEIAGTLSASPFNSSNGSAIIVCSEDTFQKIMGEGGYTVIDMQLAADATDDDVNAIHRAYGTGHSFVDKRMDNSSVRGVYYSACLLFYGFLTLIALITVFNVVNSIALSVAARTKQYGVFRAIGLSARQLSRMIVAEAATYAISGCIIGTLLGLACHRLLFDLLIGSHWGVAWTIPFAELGIILLIVALSVVAAVHGPIKRMRKMPIVDTIGAE